MIRDSVFGVSGQVQHNLGCTATDDCWRLEILDLDSRRIVAAVTMQLIWVFVFAYA